MIKVMIMKNKLITNIVTLLRTCVVIRTIIMEIINILIATILMILVVVIIMIIIFIYKIF